jgi:hypothetical protein
MRTRIQRLMRIPHPRRSTPHHIPRFRDRTGHAGSWLCRRHRARRTIAVRTDLEAYAHNTGNLRSSSC